MSAAIVEAIETPPDSLSHYVLDVSLDEQRRALIGSLQLTFTNRTGGPVDAVPFRLFPNAAYYWEGSTTVSNVTVEDIPQNALLSVFDTVLTVPFGSPLAQGSTVTIDFDFETIVPANSTGSFGIFSHDLERQTWMLSDWYPVLAGWDVDTGWGLEPPTIWGDPTFTETATYEVRLTVPSEMSVAASGQETREVSAAGDVYTIKTGPVREFALVLDDQFEIFRTHLDDIRLNLFLDGNTPETGSLRLLELARAVLQDYSQRYGPYPYDELDIVQTELAGALGVSWSGLLFIDAVRLSNDLPSVSDPTSILAFTIAHEIAHQWWGVKVGVNSNDHAFMNESLASYLSVVAWEAIFGAEMGRLVLQQQVAAPYLRYLEGNADGVVDRPIAEVGSMNEFGRLVYGKGGLGLHAIRLEIGDVAFFAALASYAEAASFHLASPDDLLAAFETAAGRNLEDLWNHWFESALTTAADVQALIAA